jgi:hypothetical protein
MMIEFRKTDGQFHSLRADVVREVYVEWNGTKIVYDDLEVKKGCSWIVTHETLQSVQRRVNYALSGLTYGYSIDRADFGEGER